MILLPVLLLVQLQELRIEHAILQEAGETFEDISPDETMPETKVKGAQI